MSDKLNGIDWMQLYRKRALILPLSPPYHHRFGWKREYQIFRDLPQNRVSGLILLKTLSWVLSNTRVTE